MMAMTNPNGMDGRRRHRGKENERKERSPRVSTIFSLGVESVQAGAGRDGRTRLNYQARTVTGISPVRLTTSTISNNTRLMPNLPKALNMMTNKTASNTVIRTTCFGMYSALHCGVVVLVLSILLTFKITIAVAITFDGPHRARLSKIV